MNAADFQAWSDAVLNRVESALSDWVPAAAPAGLGEAMRYAVLDGGKRLRPLLVLAAREAVAHGQKDAALDEAALRARFDACLLSDEEMASGPSTWTTWTNPFSDWP